MGGIEPPTSSLPRKRSTPELHRLIITPSRAFNTAQLRTINQSGRRDSNPRPSAWKADALPTELLPLISLVNKRCYFNDYKRTTSNTTWGEKDSNLRR